MKTCLLRDTVSKFGLGFNKFSFSLVPLTDTTGTFKFLRQWQQNSSITNNFMKGATSSLFSRESSINDIHSATAIASTLF